MKPNTSYKLVATALIAALSLGAQPLHAEEKKETVHVSLFSWAGYGFWFVAKEKNLAPGLDIKISVIEDPYESYGQMTAGTLDATSSTVEYHVLAADKGTGIKLVAYCNPSIGTDKIILAPDIKEPKDLKGQPVAVLEGGLTQIFMGIWLEKNGLKFDEVKYVNVIMDDAVGAMIGGTAKAGELWEPFGSKVLENLKGSKVMATSLEKYYHDTALLGDGVYFSDAFISKRPDAARQLLQAWFDGVAFWKKNPAEANAIISKALKFDVPQVEMVIGKDGKPLEGGIAVFDIEEASRFMGVMPGDPPRGWKNGQIHEHWKLTSEWWLKFGLIQKEQPIEKGVSFEPLKTLASKLAKK